MTQPARVTLALGAETVLVDRVLRAAWSGVLSQDSSAQRVEVQPGDEDAAEAISQACAPTLFGDQVAVVVRVEAVIEAVVTAVEVTADAMRVGDVKAAEGGAEVAEEDRKSVV